MLLLGIILMAVGIASMIYAILLCPFNSKLTDVGWYAFVIGLFIIICTLIVEYSQPPIKPIDVYRGKTTLEITYRDSIPVDSIVVWKPEFKK